MDEKKDFLDRYIQIWQERHFSKESASEQSKNNAEHLSEEELMKLAENDGVENAAPEILAHLTDCPICFDNWVEWCEATAVVQELDENAEESVMTYGKVSFSGDHDPVEPLELTSACGNFLLKILPEIDNPSSGMVFLGIIGDPAKYEGKIFSVRDANGLVILEGKLSGGNVARLHKDLAALDLATWVLVEIP